MNSDESPADTQAATLAAALIDRIGPVAQAATRAKEGIAADREPLGGDGEADALIEAVIARVDELEADCRRLMRILVGFEAAAQPGPAAVPPPEVEPAPEPQGPAAAAPSPAAEAAGIATFPGSAPAPPAAQPPAAAPESAAAPLAAAPPPAGDPVAVAAPPTGAPAAVAAPAEPAAVEEPAAPGPEPAEAPPSEEPVHVSEGVRLLATQMSVAGASGDDIARRLHDDFGVENADRLIAQLFGTAP